MRGSGRGDGRDVSGKIQDLVDNVDLQVQSGDWAHRSDLCSLNNLKRGHVGGRRVGRRRRVGLFKDQRSSLVPWKLVDTTSEEGSCDSVVGRSRDTRRRVGVVENVVRENLGEEGSVSSDIGRDIGKGLVVGSKDSLVSNGELTEEAHSLAGVGNGRSDTDERGQVGSTGMSVDVTITPRHTCNPFLGGIDQGGRVCESWVEAKEFTHVKAPKTVVRKSEELPDVAAAEAEAEAEADSELWAKATGASSTVERAAVAVNRILAGVMGKRVR